MRPVELFIVLLLSLGAVSCENKGPTNGFVPDFSSPEGAVKTMFHATKHKNNELFLDSLTEEAKFRYGRSRVEQLDKLNMLTRKIKADKSRQTEILGVEYGQFDGYDAVVTYRSSYDGKAPIYEHVMPVKKVGDEWRVTDSPEKQPTPEENP